MNTQAAEMPNGHGRDERAVRMCQELAEMGMELVRAAAEEGQRAMARTRPAAVDPTEAVERFVRCSRGVRRAILLENRIDQGGYEPRSPSHREDDSGEIDPGDLLAEEDDLAGDECRTVPDILAEIRAELGLMGRA